MKPRDDLQQIRWERRYILFMSGLMIVVGVVSLFRGADLLLTGIEGMILMVCSMLALLSGVMFSTIGLLVLGMIEERLDPEGENDEPHKP